MALLLFDWASNLNFINLMKSAFDNVTLLVCEQLLYSKVEARRCQSFYMYLRRDCCVFIAWGRLQSNLSASCLGRFRCCYEKKIKNRRPICRLQPTTGPQTHPTIHPINVELLRRCCADCRIIHVRKSMFFPDFLEAKLRSRLETTLINTSNA
jgi:hypothetical protein